MRSALITGASTGIGRATAQRLDRGGWRVFAGVRRQEDADSLRSEGSERLEPLLLDVTDAEAIEVAVERIGEIVGSGGLDGLVNNAGIGVAGPLETMALDDFRRQVEVNVTAQVAVTQAMLPMIRAATGRIVFMGSMGGRVALPFGAPYHVSKFALEAISDSLRQELSPWNIEVSLIEPGSIDTPIWERSEQAADEMWDRAPTRQEELYGEQLARFRSAARRTGERGIPPEKVAAAVEHALTARRPRTRYLVGADARIQTRVRRLVPDRVFDRLVAREMRR